MLGQKGHLNRGRQQSEKNSANASYVYISLDLNVFIFMYGNQQPSGRKKSGATVGHFSAMWGYCSMVEYPGNYMSQLPIIWQ